MGVVRTPQELTGHLSGARAEGCHIRGACCWADEAGELCTAAVERCCSTKKHEQPVDSTVSGFHSAPRTARRLGCTAVGETGAL